MPEEVIILFDEHGTPTFRPDRESTLFLGVGLTYKLSDENNIFTTSNQLFGLSNIRPVKNRQLSLSRVNHIGTLLTSLPVEWTIISLDLSNADLQRVVNLYEEYGNLLRDRHRGVRERPAAQILYTQVFNHVLFSAIHNHIEHNPHTLVFSVFIDNWSFSQNDRNIAIDINRDSMEQRTKEVVESFFENVTISLNNYVILITDSDRKRYIDVVASVTSRAYLPTTDSRFSDQINSLLRNSSQRHIYTDDITQITIDFLTTMMDQTARGNIS